MNILIGTPIHEMKDYCMERWLSNVAQLQRVYPADLLLVDNSDGEEYMQKVRQYCKKYGVKNYTIEHFEISTQNVDIAQLRSLRVEVAQEIIRRMTLTGNYDAWFSWECDQIIPTDTLNKLVEIMKKESYMMIVVNAWARTIPSEFNANMGITLISQSALQHAWFLPEKDGEISFDIHDAYNVDETMFKKRILQSRGNYIELYGVIEPIKHLNS